MGYELCEGVMGCTVNVIQLGLYGGVVGCTTRLYNWAARLFGWGCTNKLWATSGGFRDFRVGGSFRQNLSNFLVSNFVDKLRYNYYFRFNFIII